MDIKGIIQPGMAREENFEVTEQYLAKHLGSGTLRVLATPSMILFMEATSHRLLAENIPDGSTSVGIVVNVRHLAPTPLGSRVHVRVEVTAVDGLRVAFRVQAWDSQELIGDGEHQRMVIDHDRFLSGWRQNPHLALLDPKL